MSKLTWNKQTCICSIHGFSRLYKNRCISCAISQLDSALEEILKLKSQRDAAHSTLRMLTDWLRELVDEREIEERLKGDN
jgi:hypothetical protein